MGNEILVAKQRDLDYKKYNSSCIANFDMSGKMEYCENCLFKTEMNTCELPQQIREDYSVCARNSNKIEKGCNKYENSKKKPTRNRKTTNKSSNL